MELSNMEQMFVPAGIIATISIVLWMVKYPHEYWEYLRFKSSDRGDRIASSGTWIILVTSIWFLTVVTRVIQ